MDAQVHIALTPQEIWMHKGIWLLSYGYYGYCHMDTVIWLLSIWLLSYSYCHMDALEGVAAAS